jgi:hypothetical protein
MFKQLRETKAMLAQAPGMIAAGNEMAANAQALAAVQAQQVAAAQQAYSQSVVADAQAASPGDFEPIAGVSIELYAEISRSFAEVNYDMSQAHMLAARKGVSGTNWDQAAEGWAARIRSNPAVGQRFNALYTAA